jgi:hypothetical protein
VIFGFFTSFEQFKKTSSITGQVKVADAGSDTTTLWNKIAGNGC